MKGSILLCCFIALSASISFSQVSNSDQKKILKIVGEDFTELVPTNRYDFYTQTSGLTVDTSTTFRGDTVGLVLNGEYVMFHDLIASRKSKELTKYLDLKPVTVGEYQTFMRDVRDSIAVTKLYHNIEEDEEACKYLLIEKEYVDIDGVIQKSEPSDRAILMTYFGLNRNKKFSYDDAFLIPNLANMYLPKSERFRKQRVFDKRKYYYTYTEEIDSLIPDRSLSKTPQAFRRECFTRKAIFQIRLQISDDTDSWAKSASHDFDEGSVLAQIYTDIKEENPVVGLLGSQAKAFCHWKQKQVQKEINKAKIPFIAVVTLPEGNDLSSSSLASGLIVSEYNFTEYWRISRSEYSKFIGHVMDSISRVALYFKLESNKKALNLLNHKSIYFEEGALEYVDLDYTNRQINFELFSLNFKTKIGKNNPEVEQILSDLKTRDRSSFQYVYSSIRKSEMARKYDGPFIIDDRGQYMNNTSVTYNQPRYFQNGGSVRSIENFGEYIETHRVSIFPRKVINLDEKSEELIPSLTYEQALAYYNWKYRIDKYNPKKDDWQQFIYPSEEQFNAIQRGESIVIPEHVVEYPTPLFRYVVHIYPK